MIIHIFIKTLYRKPKLFFRKHTQIQHFFPKSLSTTTQNGTASIPTSKQPTRTVQTSSIETIEIQIYVKSSNRRSAQPPDR